MKSRNIIVLLVEPAGEQDTIFPSSVDSVVDCTQVLGGGKPLSGIVILMMMLMMTMTKLPTVFTVILLILSRLAV